MNGFRKMQERLLEDGWYVGWNLPCCQSCAWGSLPSYLGAVYDKDGYLAHPETGKKLKYSEYEKVYPNELDLSKVLFNHSQDCEVYIEGEECEACEGEGYIFDEDEDNDQEDDTCPECKGMGEIPDEWPDEADLDTSVSGFTCMTPEAQNSSYFCFDGSKEGVANFKEIIPIIEECGVTVEHFDESGKSRIELSW